MAFGARNAHAGSGYGASDVTPTLMRGSCRRRQTRYGSGDAAPSMAPQAASRDHISTVCLDRRTFGNFVQTHNAQSTIQLGMLADPEE